MNMTLQGRRFLAGSYFFGGGCGGFDGYYTGWMVMENKMFKISK